ncbi:DegT/DnrJ/EryC1/StrS family aminotransferase [Cyclobacteriaceae bacterium]|nr:DegT/DnrJ/EryC1/StrS family aminotransferase [Cyclobacteriaceae bacterium]
MAIQMVDLTGQYEKIQAEIDTALLNVVKKGAFINGEEVKQFSNSLSKYLNVPFVIPCANGTDALQISLMALGLQPGDEVIVPSFTYVATAEVICLLKLKPVMVDVDPHSFNMSVSAMRDAMSIKTKAIMPVHLFGQCVDMEPLLEIANEFGLFIIEDCAQAIGAKYSFSNGETKQAGTMGNIGCTSFFPSKNLGCFGDGGAIYTRDKSLADKIRMIANHGQEKKYIHKYIGVNSRLDTIQAAVLNVKLMYLNEYILARQKAAEIYDKLFSELNTVIVPHRSSSSTHVFHQYTLQIKNNKRSELKNYLGQEGIPSMIYYPIPMNKQEAFNKRSRVCGNLLNTKYLCSSVLSLPMHTELSEEQQVYLANILKSFFNK